MLASSVQAIVVCNATAPRVCTSSWCFSLIEAATAMNLGVFTLAVCALALLTTTTAQLTDCELSDLFNGGTLETEMSTGILNGDTPSPPTITVLRNHTVCLSVGPTIDKFSSISLLIEYTCTGSAFCPSGQAVEQFDFGCNNQGEWIFGQFSNFDAGREQNPEANFDTTLRMDCGVCFSEPQSPDDPPDPVTHCHGRPHTVLLASECHDLYLLCLLTTECRGCSDIGQMACYGSVASGCCNVYVNDMCADTCPSYDTYVIDPDTFVCSKFTLHCYTVRIPQNMVISVACLFSQCLHGTKQNKRQCISH